MNESITLLDAAEIAQLNRFEERIQQGLGSFIEVGEALSAIRDRRLYRATHATFEDYCREKWGMSASRARQLVGAADVAASVTMVTLSSERQARELARVEPARREAVVQQAVDATGGKLTAAAIREAASVKDERTFAPVTPIPAPRRAARTQFVIDEWKQHTRQILSLRFEKVPEKHAEEAITFITQLACELCGKGAC